MLTVRLRVVIPNCVSQLVFKEHVENALLINSGFHFFDGILVIWHGDLANSDSSDTIHFELGRGLIVAQMHLHGTDA